MSMGRIVFMGTPEYAVASLSALHAAGFEIAAVVTAPDRPAGRGRVMRSSAVKQRALELGIPVLQPERLRDEHFLAELDRLAASLYVVVAFRMLPAVVWSKPPLGTINLHASLLPDYRGAAPINWSVINGETESGVTTFRITHTIDAGDILLREKFPISAEDTAGIVHDRSMRVGAELLVKTVERLFSGSIRSEAQPSGPSHTAPKLTAENCRIQWTKSAREVQDLVRGLSPYPGAWTTAIIAGAPAAHFKILHTHLSSSEAEGPPGSALIQGGSMLVRTGSGWLEVLELQPEGKRRMDAAAFIRGLRANGAVRFE